jgi:signal transduction histidine kinase
MTFRVRLAVTFAVVALVPLVIFGAGVRREMTARLDAQATRRVSGLVRSLEADLAGEVRATRSRLAALATELIQDNRFRAAVLGGDRRWLLDWAGGAMRATGLASLTLFDSDGRVVSSGHFRNDFDRVDSLIPALATEPDRVVARLRTADGMVSSLLGIDSLEVAGRRFRLVGGSRLDSARLRTLIPDDEISVRLDYGGRLSDSTGPSAAGGSSPSVEARPIVAEIPLVVVDERTGRVEPGKLAVSRDLGPVRSLRRRVDRWFLSAIGLTVLAAAGASVWLAGLVSRPIAELARKTERLDLDRLDLDFSTDRADEIGALTRLLGALTTRLRAGAARLRESERRATVGDLSRQINHDIKNGLAPIRHVVRHLGQTAERHPEQLAAIYRERQGTLESSIEYLDQLARNYGKFSPAPVRTVSDVNRLVTELAGALGGGPVVIETRLASPGPTVAADPVALRRILENLVTNAVEAIAGDRGRIVLATDRVDGPLGPRVRIAVTDFGRGMTRDELERAFDDFASSKPGGTGLGLTVVRRLVADLGGSLEVATEPGRGSTFTVELPRG